MTKKEAINFLSQKWQKLNSNIELTEKIQLLEELSFFVQSRLIYLPGLEGVSISPCNLVIKEFLEKLEVEANYTDTTFPSNLSFFILAVNNSTLPDQDVAE